MRATTTICTLRQRPNILLFQKNGWWLRASVRICFFIRSEVCCETLDTCSRLLKNRVDLRDHHQFTCKKKNEKKTNLIRVNSILGELLSPGHTHTVSESCVLFNFWSCALSLPGHREMSLFFRCCCRWLALWRTSNYVAFGFVIVKLRTRIISNVSRRKHRLINNKSTGKEKEKHKICKSNEIDHILWLQITYSPMNGCIDPFTPLTLCVYSPDYVIFSGNTWPFSNFDANLRFRFWFLCSAARSMRFIGRQLNYSLTTSNRNQIKNSRIFSSQFRFFIGISWIRSQSATISTRQLIHFGNDCHYCGRPPDNQETNKTHLRAEMIRNTQSHSMAIAANYNRGSDNAPNGMNIAWVHGAHHKLPLCLCVASMEQTQRAAMSNALSILQCNRFNCLQLSIRTHEALPFGIVQLIFFIRNCADATGSLD